jgi:hypothetical protein
MGQRLGTEGMGMDVSAQRAAGADPAGLSERERDILSFERQWWKHPGVKEDSIKSLFDLTPTRYYQILNTLLDHPDALAFDPMLVKRLRRLRSARRHERSARRLDGRS